MTSSKDPGGLSLDLLPEQWMQAVPGRQVDVNAQTFLEESFRRNLVKSIEFAAGVVVEYEVF